MVCSVNRIEKNWNKIFQDLLRVNGDKKHDTTSKRGLAKAKQRGNSEEVDDVPSLLSVEETQGNDIIFRTFTSNEKGIFVLERDFVKQNSQAENDDCSAEILAQGETVFKEKKQQG